MERNNFFQACALYKTVLTVEPCFTDNNLTPTSTRYGQFNFVCNEKLANFFCYINLLYTETVKINN